MSNTEKNTGLHESYSRAHEQGGSTDRGFGFVFAGVFAVVGLLPLFSKHPIRIWALAVSAVFLLLALLIPFVLSPLNKVWTWFSLQLAKITNPIFTGLMFFVLFMPAAVLLRLLGVDLLRLRKEESASTFWISRTPPGPAPQAMRNQF